MPHEQIADKVLDTVGSLNRQLDANGLAAIIENQLNRTVAFGSAGESMRFAVPSGRTRFDFQEGQAHHIDSDTELASDLSKVDSISTLGPPGESPDDEKAYRSLLLFADDEVTLEIGGSKVPIDTCLYFPIEAIPFTKFYIKAGRPTDLYIILSAKHHGFAKVAVRTIHYDRVGSYNASADDFTGVPVVPHGLVDISGSVAQAVTDYGNAKMHSQNYNDRTFVIENTGANDLRFQIQGQAGHAGNARWVTVDPDNMPITVVSGDTHIATVNGEAWHLMRAQVAKLSGDAAGTNISAEMDVSQVG